MLSILDLPKCSSNSCCKDIYSKLKIDRLFYKQVILLYLVGALLKAAFFCSELLPLTQHRNLAEYLKDKYSSGFVLQTWSNLPHGSGLGTSSILAGSVLSALWTAAGMKHDVSSVLHAVCRFYLLQLLFLLLFF